MDQEKEIIPQEDDGLPLYEDMSDEQRTHYDAISDPLGICGCGAPVEALQLVRDVLEVCDPAEGCWDSLNTMLNARHDLRGAFVLYALDKAGWIEHGTTLYCSWRTDEGDKALEHLKALFPEQSS